MSVDVDALLAMTVEKNIPLEKLINSIEQTVTEAYGELPDAMPQRRHCCLIAVYCRGIVFLLF